MKPLSRSEWRKLHTNCWICGWPGWFQLGKWGLQCHEITRGPSRKAALTAPATWVCVCNVCHADLLGDYARWPIVRQLALKKVYDPANYDRVAVNRLRHREDEAITEEDVNREVRRGFKD